MIKVSMLKDNFDRTCGYIVDGHGKSDVCNAVSAITQTTLYGLDDVCDAQREYLYYNIIEDTGKLYVYISNDLPWYYREKFNLLLHTMEIGLINIFLDNPSDMDLVWEVCK